MDFDYKKYSLERLEEWINDAILSSEASPQEIYDVIKKATEENYHYFKKHTERCYELLALLNGNGKGHLSCDKDDPSPECKGAWDDFWEEHYYPEEAKDDGMCPWGHSDMEYLIANTKKETVKKWVLPVEEVEDGDTGKQEYFITFPDDLLEAANLAEGAQVEWIDNNNGSFTLKKIEQSSWMKGNELARVKTYQEMIDDGWTMTDDGFWIKEN